MIFANGEFTKYNKQMQTAYLPNTVIRIQHFYY